MHPTDRRQFRQGFWATTLATLASRVLGMLRDATTASLLGLAAGGVMDAFVLAFRLANLSRRLLGEGALATSYLPVLATELERDREAALRLAAAVLARLAGVLAVLVLAGEAVCGLLWIASSPGDGRLLVGLLAALLPYLGFICLAAQLSATLHALGKFRLPALAATTLNLGWLAGAWWVAPYVAQTAVGRAYALAGSIVVAGALQAAIQLVALGRLGLSGRIQKSSMSPFSMGDKNGRLAWQRIVRPMGPIALALSVTQLSTLVDSSLAWLLTRPTDGLAIIAWLPGSLLYPLHAGATAALYYAERFYQLPVGLLGVAAATVIFPQLSRHAARGDRTALAGDLTSGLRLVVCLSLPATVGLVLLAEPLSRLVLGHGAFDAADVARTVSTTRAYALGIAAYCALPLLLRGFYAVGDARRPLLAAAWALAINTLLDVSLAWPLGESGLALATAISSLVQLLVLGASFSRIHAALAWRELAAGALKATIATGALAVAVLLVCPAAPAGPMAAVAARLALATIAGGVVFFAALWLLDSDELAMLWPRASRRKKASPAGNPVGSVGNASAERHRSSGRGRGYLAGHGSVRRRFFSATESPPTGPATEIATRVR
ncbi:MAG TPA: murein biosynthesis integral membrane protein MurJ [Pirellulales bacterium]|jgi:putative peptidoglycan lipid II flippase